MQVEVYRREDKLWDWRMVASNGEIVATSGGQGYTERNDAREGWERVEDAVIFADHDPDKGLVVRLLDG